MHLADQRVTVMGLGRFGGGVGVTRFLVEQGADVLVTDTDPPEKLADSVAKLADLPVAYRLGEHNVSDFTTCDLVVANPAVKPHNRFLRAARAANVPVTSEIRLLVERLPNRKRTIGVTGSAGKSTTAAMIAHILASASPLLFEPVFDPEAQTRREPQSRRQRAGEPPDSTAPTSGVWLGGNIGGSLLNCLPHIRPDDWVVLELSSFMLHSLRAHDTFRGWSPHIAVVTNITPNHLDWHGTYEEYVAAKLVILDYKTVKEPSPIIGPGVHEQLAESRRKYIGAWPDSVRHIDLKVPGKHNQINAILAIRAAGFATHGDPADHAAALADFPGLPHRLQFVAEKRGIRCYNDSKCTTPEAAVLAIESFPPGIVHVILGGYDKGSDLTALARVAAERCAALYLIGATAPTLAEAASAAGRTTSDSPRAAVHACGDLDTAVVRAFKHARPGHVLLLSPGCASYDQFTNYEHRGDRFIQLVQHAEP